MPYLNLKLSSAAEQHVCDAIASALTELTVSLLGKKRTLTAVVLETVAPHQWYIGAAALKAPSLYSFYLNIKVTEGTNTKDQKAEFIARVHAAMTSILGPIAPESYIVIDEVHGDAWGYQGQTQELRYIRGKAL